MKGAGRCEEACGGGVEPLKPTVAKIAAEDITAIVNARKRRAVSQPKWRVCSQVRAPVAVEAAAIAQPTHMR
jgi:hypothetical protein